MEYDLVLEGGGAKGVAFVGALQAMEAEGATARRVIGTSAGAITAALVAAGFDSTKIAHAMDHMPPGWSGAHGAPFERFLDTPAGFSSDVVNASLLVGLFSELTVDPNSLDLGFLPTFLRASVQGRIAQELTAYLARELHRQLEDMERYRNVFSLIELGGLYEGADFVDWLSGWLDTVESDLGDYTLAEFHDWLQGPASSVGQFAVLATNVTKRRSLVLNHNTAPDVPLKWAVRMSMSFPFAWQEVVWDEAWGEYTDYSAEGDPEQVELAGDRIVDGGVLSNFPLALLTADSEQTVAMMDRQADDCRPLGLLLDEQIAVPNDPAGGARAPSAQGLVMSRMFGRVGDLLDTMGMNRDGRAMRAHEELICRLPAKGYGTLDFGVDKARKQAMIDAAREATTRHLRGMPGVT